MLIVSKQYIKRRNTKLHEQLYQAHVTLGRKGVCLVWVPMVPVVGKVRMFVRLWLE
jgi:hypothetical protein